MSGFDGYEQQDCINCFIKFRVPIGFTNARRKDNQSFYCPNGHAMSYQVSQLDLMRRERDRLKQQQAEYEDRLRRQREAQEATERRLAAARGQLTKLKNRASKGVCPCCNRSFENLRRHMASKHPDFATDNVVELKAESA